MTEMRGLDTHRIVQSSLEGCSDSQSWLQKAEIEGKVNLRSESRLPLQGAGGRYQQPANGLWERVWGGGDVGADCQQLQGEWQRLYLVVLF